MKTTGQLDSKENERPNAAASRPRRETFIRFVVPASGKTEGAVNGIFVAAYRLCEAAQLPKWETDNISALLVWTKAHLQIPHRFTSSKSKGHYRRNTRGLSWFKDSAHEHIGKMRELSSLLRGAGLDVDEKTTQRPGYIVYEDEYQIVAEPFGND